MKILQIHKYFSKKRGGGSVSAFFETVELLQKHGHEVRFFSMQDTHNELTPDSVFFAKHFDLRSGGFLNKLRALTKIFYNRDAVEQLDRMLQDYKPDVAHVHNIYHYLTPGIFTVLKKHNIPIVFKLSDYHAICPNYKLFAHGKIDNSCKDKKYYKLFFNKSINNSWSESFAAMIEGYINNWFGSYDKVDIFTAPSEFMKNLCIEYGIPADKIVVLRNVLNFDKYQIEPNLKKEKIFLYMGRLSEEKGLKVAIDAVKILKKSGEFDEWKFVMAGKGPCESRLKKYVSQNNLDDVIEFVGFVQKGSPEWTQLMQKSAVSILPSLWYDNSPIAISESMAFGVPVIVSDAGGTKEMITDAKSGFVFESGNSVNLAQKMKRFIANPDLSVQMGVEALTDIRKLNSEEKYYDKLFSIYKKVN